MKQPKSDIVELILAVDLNPSDPEEPININDVTVTPKGEGDEGCALCQRILDAVADIDPALSTAIQGKSHEEAAESLEAMADAALNLASEDAEEEDDEGEMEDAFSKITKGPKSPFGMDEDEDEDEDEEDDPFSKMKRRPKEME